MKMKIQHIESCGILQKKNSNREDQSNKCLLRNLKYPQTVCLSWLGVIQQTKMSLV